MNYSFAMAIRSLRWLAIISVGVIVGCDSGPQMGTVTGTVTNAGSPVTAGTIVFFPETSGPMAQGQLDAEGSYTLTTKQPGDGALVGRYLVAVLPPTDADVLMAELKPGQMSRKTTYDKIPKNVRTHTTSGLQATINPGANKVDFDLAATAAR